MEGWGLESAGEGLHTERSGTAVTGLWFVVIFLSSFSAFLSALCLLFLKDDWLDVTQDT